MKMSCPHTIYVPYFQFLPIWEFDVKVHNT